MKQVPENRGEDRRSVHFRAHVALPDSRRTIPCIVRDASLSGCQIVCDGVRDLPDDIQLVVANLKHPIDGRIVWRRGKQAGVSFRWRPDDVVEPPMTDLAPSQ